MSNKNVKKAQEVLEEISQDEEERFWAEQRLIRIADEKAIADAGYDKGLNAGYDKGLNAGMTKGIRQGSKIKEIEIAKNMLKEKANIEFIIRCTGLSKEEIEKLKEKN